MGLFGKSSHDLSNRSVVWVFSVFNRSEVVFAVFGGFDDMLNNKFVELLFSDLFASDADESLVVVKLLINIHRGLISYRVSSILEVVLLNLVRQE